MRTKRLIALLLTLCFVLTSIPFGTVSAYAAESGSDVRHIDVPYQTNPLYEGLVDTNASEYAVRSTPARTYGTVSYISEDEVVPTLRKAMVNRDEKIEINFRASSSSIDLNSFFEEALAHTGNPVEGDYLRYTYAGMEADADVYNDGRVEAIYLVDYYTTSTQETTVDSAVKSLLSQLNLTGKTDYQKVRTIYEYITETVRYDHANLNNQSYTLKFSAYAALINKTAVCQGYANLFYRLALELGIDARIISGIGNGGSHGWNIVELNGKYYNLDATWDEGVAPANFRYFLRCPNNFSDHTRNEEYTTTAFHKAYPMATADYKDSGLSITTQPTNVTATAGDKVTFKVVASGNDLSYQWQYQKPGSSTWYISSIASSKTATYSNTANTAHDGYKYRCVITDGNGNKVTSNIVALTVKAAEQLAAPTITVTNRASDGKPTISWSKVDGATGYEVYRADSSGGTYKLLYTAKDPNKLSVTHTGAAVGNDYFYKVCALNGDVQGQFSSAKGVWCDLKRPTVTVTLNSNGKPYLKWSEVTGADSYKVYRSTDGESWSLIYTAKGNDFDVTHTGAKSGVTYKYKVIAIDESNSKCNSAYSQVKSITCPAAEQLAAPTITVTNRASDGKPVISWNKVTGATGYEVYRADSSGGTYKLLYTAKDPNKLSVTHTGAAVGNDYFYKVRALNGDIQGKFSSAKGVWCDLARPTVTVTLNSNGKPYLKWSEVTGADSYKVYRSTDGESWSLIYTAKGNDFDVTHTGAKSGVTYKYKVIAIDESNSKCNSAYSQVKTITCR